MNLAFVGTGLMGRPMVARLLDEGHVVTTYNRTPEKTRHLRERGARVVSTPVEAVEEGKRVIVMLSDMAAIRETLLTPEILPALAGRTCIQMGTIAPDQSREIDATLSAAGAEYLEAPVLGSIPEAESGRLIVMCGGYPAVFEANAPLLQAFGPEPLLIGPVGHAAALKLALNQLIAALTNAFALSLGLVQREGVAVDAFMKVVRGSALYAPTFDKKLQRMLDRDYASPNFPTRHLLKDVDLFLGQARGDGLDTRALEGIRSSLEEAMMRGLADTDYAALYEVIDPSAAEGR